MSGWNTEIQGLYSIGNTIGAFWNCLEVMVGWLEHQYALRSGHEYYLHNQARRLENK